MAIIVIVIAIILSVIANSLILTTPMLNFFSATDVSLKSAAICIWKQDEVCALIALIRDESSWDSLPGFHLETN